MPKREGGSIMRFIGQIQNVHGTVYDFYQEMRGGIMHFSIVPHGAPAPAICPDCDIQWLFRTKCISKY